MKNEVIITKLILDRLAQLAKPTNLKERNEKKDLAALTYCEIELDEENIQASVCFNDNDLWFSYKVDYRDVVSHFYDVSGYDALVDLDIEGSRTQWVSIYDIEMDNHDVLTYLIDNNLLGDYINVTNEMGEVLYVVA